MIRICQLILLALLGACGAQPAPLMFGGARHETTVNGRDYVLYRKDNRVEVIRMGWASSGNIRKSVPR